MRPANRTRAVIFDGDDTLWQNQVFYDEAKGEFYHLMERQGFDRRKVSSYLAEIDVANVARFGFSKLRFAQSMQDVYDLLCAQQDRPVDPAILDEVRSIGISVFQRTPLLLEGAPETLMRLRAAYRLYLYTAGEPDIQRGKLAALKIEQYFDRIQIIERKEQTQLRLFLKQERLSPHRTWMVGNSLRSDINPALGLGLRCIWLISASWEYDSEELLPGGLWEVSNLNEIPDIIMSQDNIPIVKQVISGPNSHQE